MPSPGQASLDLRKTASFGNTKHAQPTWKSRASRRALAYGMTNFSAAVLNNVFITYYVEMALSVSHVSGPWFMAAQVVYCIWNSLNDPVCGWWGDKHAVHGEKGFQRRIPRIRRGGPLWALSFLLMWFPWADGAYHPTIAGLHLVLTLIMYDGWLSYTLVNHQALLADMTNDNTERELCNMYGAGCQIAGSLAIFLGHLFWNPKDMALFQKFAVVAAGLSCFGFYMTTSSKDIDESCAHLDGSSPRGCAEGPTLSTFGKQTLKHKNLWVFILMSFFQQFSCTFNTNFFSMFLALLVGQQLSSTQQSAILYASFIIPHLGTMLVTPLLSLYGKKLVISMLFLMRLVVAVVGCMWIADLLGVAPSALLLGGETFSDSALAAISVVAGDPNNAAVGEPLKQLPSRIPAHGTADQHTVTMLTWVIAGTLLVNRILTENVCRLQPLVITDLVDEDCILHHRRHTMSSMMFGSVALFTKPAQSLAPMYGFAVLSRNSDDPLKVWTAVLGMLFLVPIVNALIEFVIWTRYKLDGSQLAFVKQALRHQLPSSVV
eukprot:Sspe_Gene.11792::Locus_4001_Transcript_1_1_Confidence_1.000_Length_1744::g.11792::m.11792